MLSLSHTIISLPFGVFISNPLIAFMCAFAMHLGSDRMLHWNIYPHHYKKYPFFLVALDCAAGIIISIVLLGSTAFTLPVLAAILGGNMPDILHTFWSFAGTARQKKTPRWVQRAFSFHEHIQRETESPLVGGLSQIIFGSIAISVILIFR